MIKVVNGQTEFHAEITVNPPICADLACVEPFVFAVEFGRVIRSEIEIGVKNRKKAQGYEWRHAFENLVSALQDESVKTKIVRPDHRGTEERIVEPANGNCQILIRTTAELVLQKSAVKPERVPAKVPSLRPVSDAERLVLRDWRIILAGGAPDPNGKPVAQIRLQTDPGAQPDAVPRFVDIQLRRKHASADIKRWTGIDGIKVRECARVVVTGGIIEAFVADPDIAKQSDPADPIGKGARSRPVFFTSLCKNLLLDLVAHLLFDDFRNVSDTHGIVRTSDERGSWLRDRGGRRRRRGLF